MRDFTPGASIEVNLDFVWVWTESECGLWRPDFAAGISRYNRDVEANILGQAILAALAKSRRVETDEQLFGGMRPIDRIRLWENEEMAALGYKTLRAMYRNMMRVSVERDHGVITFAPSRHDKLQAWEGFARDDADHQPVLIDANASPEDIGEAALLALSRCA